MVLVQKLIIFIIRRVEKQNDFIRLVKVYTFAVLRCLQLHPLELSLVTTCLPKDISEHSHFKRFLTSIHELYQKKYKEQLHIEDYQGHDQTEILGLENNNGSPYNRTVRKLQAWNLMVDTCFQSTPAYEPSRPRSLSNVSNIEVKLSIYRS